MNIVYQTKNSNTPAILTTGDGTVGIASNAKRIGWMIQNVGTGVIFVSLGGTASATVFHAVLKGGSGDSDGLGASISQMSGVVFTGFVSVAGTTPKFVVTELAP